MCCSACPAITYLLCRSKMPSMQFIAAFSAVPTCLPCRSHQPDLPLLPVYPTIPACISYHLPCSPNSLPFPSCLLCPACLLFLPVLLYLPACHCYFSILAASALPAIHTCLLFCHSHPGVPVCPACHFHSCLPAVPSSLSCLPDCPAVPT